MFTDWIDFTIEDLVWNEDRTFTKKSFEEEVKDKVVAVEVENNLPKYIWTEKFCFTISAFTKIHINSPMIIGVPRNPDYKTK